MDHHNLAVAVREERQGLLQRWRQAIRQLPSAQELDAPTLTDHIPQFLDELADELQAATEQTIQAALIDRSARSHGVQRFLNAFDIQEVVAEYNILRGCIHDLADDKGIKLQGRPFHVINRVFDRAIGVALEAYAKQKALEVQQRREDYLAFVAHDLRTPLFAISLVGRVLERTFQKRDDLDESVRMLKALRRNAQQLEILVNKVLEENASVNAEGGVTLHRRDFYLWPLVEALIEDLQAVAQPASTRLLNQVPDDLVVFADAGLLRRVFQNLIVNAINHTPGGEVVIEAVAGSAHGAVECWVQDNGSGIAKEQLGNVFAKGETDAASSGAAGLGLAIVQTFTEAHGGIVTAESSLGKGSTFRLTLPARDAS